MFIPEASTRSSDDCVRKKETKQEFEGNTVVDSISTINMYLNDGTLYSGAINTYGAAGAVYVEISEDSTWKLTGDSYITSLFL